MKKFFISFVTILIWSTCANAQNSSGKADNKKSFNAEEKTKTKDERAQRWRNASDEEKQKMDSDRTTKTREPRQNNYENNNSPSEERGKMEQHRALMEKLTSEQREAVEKEMDRHRAEMKKITGFDLPSPPKRPDRQMPDENDHEDKNN